jgi:DNA-directed RNA polymerase subunit M/transcription elongation factor TFIIS
MVEFCPECGNLLRKKSCKCGYNEPEKQTNVISLKKIWKPPSPNIIYCKLTATPFEKLKSMLNKGLYPEKLKEIKEKVRNHLYSCANCVYYYEDMSHCKLKNNYIQNDSICKTFEPFEKLK